MQSSIENDGGEADSSQSDWLYCMARAMILAVGLLIWVYAIDFRPALP